MIKAINYRYPATIEYVKEDSIYNVEPNTYRVGLVSPNYRATFGDLWLPKPEDLASFKAMLMMTFGVYNLEELVGKEVYVLNSFPYYNDPVEGLECIETGRKMTITGFRRMISDGSKPVLNPLEEKTESTCKKISSLLTQIEELKHELGQYVDDYKDWE